MVKVNPADVVAVPTDYNGTKMRVCRFEVLEECKQEAVKKPLYDVDSVDSYEEDDDIVDCDACGENDLIGPFCHVCGSPV
jgi:hypothetical protein